MKFISYVGLVLIFATACSKKNDVVALDAAAITGIYDVSRLTISGTGTDDGEFNYPIKSGSTTRTARLDVSKLTATTVNVKLTISTTGTGDVSQDLGVAELRGTDLYQGGGKAGTADGSTLAIDVTDTSKVRYVVLSKKR